MRVFGQKVFKQFLKAHMMLAFKIRFHLTAAVSQEGCVCVDALKVH